MPPLNAASRLIAPRVVFVAAEFRSGEDDAAYEHNREHQHEDVWQRR